MTSPKLGPLTQSRGTLPWGITASEPDPAAFCDWLQAHRDDVRGWMLKHGAIMIRGLDAGDAPTFERIVRVIEPELSTSYFGTSPRDLVSGAVFHASELPGHYPIPSHAEMSFLPHPPHALFFGCAIAPERFGETPIVDFRRVWRELRAEVRERLTQRGIRIVRNYAAPGAPPDVMQLKPWPDLFGTTDKSEVARVAAEHEMELTWRDDGGLRIVSFQPAFRTHPETGEDSYYSHVQVFHAGTAAAEYRRIARLRPTPRHLLTAAYAQILVSKRRLTTARDDHPMHATWADGSEIATADLDHVRDTIWANLAIIPWQRGDILAIDNRSVAHGRLPFTGPREIIVSWA